MWVCDYGDKRELLPLQFNNVEILFDDTEMLNCRNV